MRALKELQDKAEETLQASLAKQKEAEEADAKNYRQLSSEINADDLDERRSDMSDPEDNQMSDEVKKIIEERMQETAKEKEDQFVDHSDMYMERFKNNFGQIESRNSVGKIQGRESIGRRNKPIDS